MLKVRINALKNKIGFRGLTMDQRTELEERIQQELFNFHFNQDMHREDRTAAENDIELEEMKDAEEARLKQ